jgi:Zn-dependent protease
MKCEFCGAEESLPFVCNYCGGVFCGNHRLPEAHMCKGDINMKRVVQPPPQQSAGSPPPGYYSNYSQPNYSAPRPHPPGKAFSRIEARDIILAWLALGAAFGIAFVGGIPGVTGLVSVAAARPGYVETYFLVMLVTVGSGFILHELSHKFMAERHGFWAEFRVWPVGLILAILSSLFGLLLAAPGATYVAGSNISERENGIISLAGPALNVVIAVFFLPFLLTGMVTISSGGVSQLYFYFPWGFLGLVGVYVNAWLGTFNLLPIWVLDGSKVFRWNKKVWAAFFFPLLVVSYIAIVYLLPSAYNWIP